MTNHRAVFNHVGLCVADRARSRRFYEILPGFEFWCDLKPSNGSTDQLLRLADTIGLHAAYLIRDDLVLELLDYSQHQVHAGAKPVVDQDGLTHLSLSLPDLGDVVDGLRRAAMRSVNGQENVRVRVSQ